MEDDAFCKPTLPILHSSQKADLKPATPYLSVVARLSRRGAATADAARREMWPLSRRRSVRMGWAWLTSES
ncbi:unnamed protein product [Urochloa humidicola]